MKVVLPKEIPADSRAELVRELEASAQVATGAAQTLYVIAATVATIDIVWKWYQAARARAKDKHLDVVITTPDGKQVHLEKATQEEVKRIFDF